MKILTQKLVRTLLVSLFWSYALNAAPLSFDDPQFVRLSDGRIVPFGQGQICDNECPTIEALPSNNTTLKILVPSAITTLVIACLINCGGASTTVQLPPGVPTNQPEPEPTPVPEPAPASLIFLGTGLYLIGRKVSK